MKQGTPIRICSHDFFRALCISASLISLAGGAYSFFATASMTSRVAHLGQSPFLSSKTVPQFLQKCSAILFHDLLYDDAQPFDTIYLYAAAFFNEFPFADYVQLFALEIGVAGGTKRGETYAFAARQAFHFL